MCCQPLLASTQAATDVAGEKNATRHSGDNATTRQGNKTNKRYKTTIQTNATACMFRVCIMFATPFSVCFETRHGSKLFDVSSGLVATICRHILGVLRVFRPRCTIHLYPHPCTHAALHLQRARSVVSIARFTLHHTCGVTPAACRQCSIACWLQAMSIYIHTHARMQRYTCSVHVV